MYALKPFLMYKIITMATLLSIPILTILSKLVTQALVAVQLIGHLVA